MTTTPEKVFTAPDEMRDRLNDNETDPVFSRAVLRYIEKLERGYRAACGVADGYKDDFHKAADLAQSCASVKPLEFGEPDKNGGYYCCVEIGTGFEAYYSIEQQEYDLAEVCFGIVCHEFGDKVIWKGPKDQAIRAANDHNARRTAKGLNIRTEAEVRREALEEVQSVAKLVDAYCTECAGGDVTIDYEGFRMAFEALIATKEGE